MNADPLVTHFSNSADAPFGSQLLRLTTEADFNGADARITVSIQQAATDVTVEILVLGGTAWARSPGGAYAATAPEFAESLRRITRAVRVTTESSNFEYRGVESIDGESLHRLEASPGAVEYATSSVHGRYDSFTLYVRADGTPVVSRGTFSGTSDSGVRLGGTAESRYSNFGGPIQVEMPVGLISAAPTGPAPVALARPANRTVYLAPLGVFPAERLGELAAFYKMRYGIDVNVLGKAAIPDGAFDRARNQLIGEKLIEAIVRAHTQGIDTTAVVIGVTEGDMYLTSSPDWNWAFGQRQSPRLRVIATHRMRSMGVYGDQLEDSRLRKLVTKYIGTMYYGLEDSPNPKSVLYNNILSLLDLDRMGDDFLE